ncbi:beta propeller repeat protein [Actinophytocola sp. KF-1]
MPRTTGRVLVAALLLLLTACGDRPDAGSNQNAGSNQDAAGFTVLRRAVEFPSVSDWIPPGQGLRQLVPLGGCVLGVGTYANGQRNVGANWTGNAGCTRLSIDPAPRDDQVADGPPERDGWAGGGLSGVVLPWDDGTLIGATDGLARRTPDGAVTPLAAIPFDNSGRSPEAPGDARATAIARSGDRILVVGNGSGQATVYVSDDAGATVRGIALPQAPGGAHDQPYLVAAAGADVVATGYGGDWLTTWHSADGGTTWRAARLRTGPDQWLVHVLVKVGTTWHAIGTVGNPKGPDRPLWMSSTDGTTWTPRDTTAMGEGGVVAATVDREGALVLVGVRDQVGKYSPGGRETYCGVVWTGAAGGPYQRGELDCNEFPPSAAATLADGRVLIAGNRDLWVRD